MLDRREIERVIELQRRTYELLQWLSRSLEGNRVTVPRTHSDLSPSEAAADWLRDRFMTLPPRCRPEEGGDREVREFANLLASYLLTSFDVVEDPGVRAVTDCGCTCAFCSRLVAAPHLQPKKMRPAYKRRARVLKIEYLSRLAAECGTPITPPEAEALLEDDDLSEAVALAVYGEQLLRRVRGDTEGPAILALWRAFAWERTGSPKKEFRLSAERVLEAEKKIVRRLERPRDR